MNKKIITVALSAVVVVAACVGMVTLVHSGNLGQTSTVPATEEPAATQPERVITEEYVPQEPDFSEAISSIAETVAQTAATTAPQTHWYDRLIKPEKKTEVQTEPTETTEATTVPSSVTVPTTAPATTEKTTKPQTTKEKTTKAQKTTAPQEPTRKAITSSGTLASDMTLSGLSKQGYDTIGRKNFICNNDKDCAQSKFGYNRFYDSAAGLLDFHIDTCRLPFKNYDGRDWMIQLWKGTYITGDIGTVGCEIGLYNRKAGKYGGAFDHYACAEEPDWLKMEMTLLWDENYDNNFKAQFTRVYTYYWWPTGFVDGQLRNVKDTSCLRVLGRITFKDDIMAGKFVDSLINAGFTEVSKFTLRKDTFKQQICDVIFCWQDVRD